MSKVRKSILLIGILVIVVAASLATALALFASGSIKTDPIELVYSVKDTEKVYDGTPLKATEYRLDSGELNIGHHAQVEFLGEQTGVGTSQSDLSVKIYDDEGYNVTHNYIIKVVCGELSVKKKSISIDLPSQKVEYNGATVMFSDYRLAEDSEGDLVSGHKIYGSTDAALMNVGDTLPRDLTPLVFDVAGNDVTENYKIDFNIGDIEIIPRHISITPESYEKVYDGMEIVADKIKFIEGSLVAGQYAVYKINENLTNRIREVDEKELEITDFKVYTLVGGEEVDVTENYEIDIHDETATLKVTPRPLTVVAKSGEWVYNGERHSFESDTLPLSIEGLADTDRLRSVSYLGSLTDVGAVTNFISDVSLTCNLENYNITRVSGTLTVTKYQLEIQTPTARKYYDGDALSATEMKDITLANAKHVLVAGAEAPSITNAQTVENKFAYAVKDGDADVTRNYAITYKYGTLTVNKMPVTVTLGTDTKTYNAQVQTPSLGADGVFAIKAGVIGADIKPIKLTKDNFDIVSYARNTINAGEYSFSVKFKDNSGEEGEEEEVSLSDNYSLEVTNYGYLVIEPAAVTVKTGEGKIIYNGMPLTSGKVVAIDPATETELSAGKTGALIKAGHKFTAPKNLPSITNVGEIENEFVAGVTDENGADISKNYAITYKYGKLTVTPREITVMLNSFTNEKAYTFSNAPVILTAEDAISKIFDNVVLIDGVEHELIEKENFTVVTSDKVIKDVKSDYTYTVKITDKSLANNFELNINNDYGATPGKISVKEATVTVVLRNFSEVYDSESHTVDAYTAIKSIRNDPGGLLSYLNFDVKFDDTDLKTQVDDYPYVVAFKSEKENLKINGIKNKNYKIETENEDDGAEKAVLKITKRPLTVTTATETLEYNGMEQSCPLFTHGELANSGHVVEVSGNVPKVTNAGEVKENLFAVAVKFYESGTEYTVTTNYDIKMVYGTISVSKRKITVYTNDYLDKYDDDEHFDTDIRQNKISNLIEGHSVEYDGMGYNSVKYVTDGAVSNEFGLVVKDSSGALVTANYEITPVYGTLQVTERPITVNTADVKKVYDGDAVYNTDVNRPADLLSGHKVAIADGFEDVPLLTHVGKIANEFPLQIKDGSGNDVTANYDINPVYGNLEITPLKVTVEIKDFTGDNALTYSGETLTLNLDDVIAEAYKTENNVEEVNGLNYEIVYSGNFVDAGEAAYTLRIVDDGEDFLASDYELTVVAKSDLSSDTAIVEIKPMTVYVGLKNYTFTFDNTYKTVTLEDSVLFTDDTKTVRDIRVGDADGELIDEDLLNMDELRIVQDKIISASGTPYRYSLRIPDRAKAKNFKFANSGSITVNKLAVTVTPNTVTRDYNGLSYVPVMGDLVTIDSELLNIGCFNVDFEIDFTVNPDAIKDAKTYGYKVKLLQRTDFDDDDLYDDYVEYINNFNISLSDEGNGEVIINRAKVNITLKNLTLTYNGEIRGGQITPEVAIVSDLNLYNVNYLGIYYIGESGNRDNTIVVKDAGVYTYSVEVLSENKNFDVILKDADGIKVTGTVTIEKAAASVILDNKYVTYDGNDVDLSDTNERDKLILNFSGVKLEKGDFELKYTDTLEGGNAKHRDVGYYSYTAQLKEGIRDNYDLPMVIATVTVNARQITVITPSKSKVYDGTALKADGTEEDYKTIIKNGVSEHYAVVKTGDEAPVLYVAGELQNKFDVEIFVRINNIDINVTDNYTIVGYEYGTLKITPVEVNVETTGAEKSYDGKALKGGKYNDEEIDGVIKVNPNHRINVSAPVEIIGVGEAEDKIELTIEAFKDGEWTDVTGCYKFNYTYGTLKIKKRVVKIGYTDYVVPEGGSTDEYLGYAFEYDSTQKSLDENAYTLEVLRDANDAEDADLTTFIGKTDLTIKYSGDVTDVGEYEYWVEFVDANNAECFELSYAKNGKLVIAKAKLAVNITAFSEFYNGQVRKVRLSYVDEYGNIHMNIEIGTNYDDLKADDFNVVYIDDEIKNVGLYRYTVELKNSELAAKYNLYINDGNGFAVYEIKKSEVKVTLKDYIGADAFVYNGKTPEINVSDAVTIAEDPSNYLRVSDFEIVFTNIDTNVGSDYLYTVRLLDRDLTGYEISVLNGEDEEESEHGGKVEIAKRVIYLGMSDLIISQREYEETDGAFDVRNLIFLSSGTLVEGEILTVDPALATQVDDAMQIRLDVYVPTVTDKSGVDKTDNYDIRVIGGDELVSRLIIMG